MTCMICVHVPTINEDMRININNHIQFESDHPSGHDDEANHPIYQNKRRSYHVSIQRRN